MSISKRIASDVSRLRFGEDQARGYRSAVTRSRRLEGNVDLSQLPEDSTTNVGADSGGMKFSLGYSRLGGGHKLG